MTVAQRVKAARLPFRLSDITLFTIDVMLAHRSFAPMADSVAPDDLDLPQPDNGAVGWHIEGLPVANADAPIPARIGPWLCYVKARYGRYFADLSGGFDEYLQKFSPKTRATQRRKLRRFAEESGGEVSWKCFHLPEDMDEFYRLARAVSSKTYQERLLKVGLPEGPKFEAKMLDLARAGAVRGYILFLRGEPVSYLYLPIEGERAIYAYLGYDPVISDLSPGTVLQLLAMEDLCRNSSVQIFDFTQGSGQHKASFGTHRVDSVDLLLLPPKLRYRGLIFAHASWTRAEAFVGRCFERIGLKQKLKAMLRRN